MNDYVRGIYLEMFSDFGKTVTQVLLSDAIIAGWFPKLPNDMENQLTE